MLNQSQYAKRIEARTRSCMITKQEVCQELRENNSERIKRHHLEGIPSFAGKYLAYDIAGVVWL